MTPPPLRRNPAPEPTTITDRRPSSATGLAVAAAPATLAAALLFLAAISAGEEIFSDGFESGGLCHWSSVGGMIPCTPPEDVVVLERDGLHLNEISPRPISRGLADDGGPPPLPWIEIFHGGPGGVDLTGHELATAVHGIVLPLPAVILPEDAFLTVFLLPAGTTAGDFGLGDDLDFLDGEGTVYLDGGAGLDPAADDLLLRSEIEDLAFVAFGEPLPETSALETDAVAAEVWTAGSRVDVADLRPGETFGLVVDGFHESATEAFERGLAPAAPRADDYRTLDWTDQTLGGIQQPSRPLQISPPNGAFFPAFPVDLEWSSCPGASSYLLELRDREDPTDPNLETESLHLAGTSWTVTAAQADFDPIWWSVACLFDEDRTRTPFVEPWVVGTGAVDGGGGGGPDSASLAVAHRYQRKDTGMLCLYDAENGDRIGCEESIVGPDGACDWDAPHAVASKEAVRACGPAGENNCVRASIQMVHDFLTGGTVSLSQDYVSHRVFSAVEPPGVAAAADPEGDLGAGVGMTVAQTVTALADFLGVEEAEIDVDEGPTFSEIRDWIDAGRPVIVFRWWAKRDGGHASVVYGYQSSPFNGVFVHDPTDGPSSVLRYSEYSSRGLRTTLPITAIVPPAVATMPVGNPPNAFHPSTDATLDDAGDGDGVVGFDEVVRFGTDPHHADTDRDQVSDREEVHSYTFPLGPSTLLSRPPDLDLDLLRAELDCDSDTSANVLGGWSDDHDGGEDLDGDGGHGEPAGVGAGETDVFDPLSTDQALALSATSVLLGEEVRLVGGTLHADFAYDTETFACPGIPPGTPIGGPPFGTGPTGHGDDLVFVCERAGCFITYLDVTNDGIWLHPDRGCDLSFPFECQPCDHPDDTGDDYEDPTGENPEDPIAIPDIAMLTNRALDSLDFDVVTVDGPDGTPPDRVGEILFEIADPPSAPPNAPPQTNGAWVWLQFQFPEVGVPALTWWQWDPTAVNWVPFPEAQAVVQVQPLEAGVDGVDGVRVTGPSTLPLAVGDRTVAGVRVVSHSPAGFFDAMPPTAPGPVFDAFVSLGSCVP